MIATVSSETIVRDKNSKATVAKSSPYVAEPQKNIIKRLNKLLSSEETKMRGMTLMVAHIPTLNKEEFIKSCVKWMQICCNVDDYNGILLSLSNLELLIKKSASYGELNGSVSYFLKFKFFGKFFKHFKHFSEGWKCVELCITHYKGSCTAHQERLKQVAVAEIEKKIVPPSVAQVYALIPSIGEAGCDGINYTNKWKTQLEDVLKICNSILHDLYKDVVESQAYEDNSYEKYCSLESVDESLLYMLFHNYCGILQFMLLCPFPVAKSIAPLKILDVVCRCLGVTTRTLGQCDTTQKIRLAGILPQFHIKANSLLKALIAACKVHLLPFSGLMTKLINQTIQSTEGSNSNEEYCTYVRLRISAYETWSKWILASAGGGAVQSDVLALAALNDISIGNADPKPTGSDTLNSEATKNFRTSDLILTSLCSSALKVLNVYVREIGAVLKADQLKAIQMGVIKQILNVQHSSSLTAPYSSSKCRYELYSLLMELVNCQNPTTPSPVNWALELFKRGIYDPASEVANFCSSGSGNIKNIIDQECIHIPPMDEAAMQTD